MAQNQVMDVNWWHEALIDWLVANPDSRLGEAALFFGKSRSWISVLMHSDVFKARFQKRLENHRTLMSREITDRVHDITHIALEEIERRLDEERDTITFNQLLSASETVLKAGGYSPGRSGAALNFNIGGNGPTQINIGEVPRDVLNRARDKAKSVEEAKLLEHKDTEAEDRILAPVSVPTSS